MDKSEILAGFMLLKSFKTAIMSRIDEPQKSAELVAFVLEIIESSTKARNNGEIIGEILDKLLDFREKNGEVYADLFKILDEFLSDYEKNSAEINQNLKKLENLLG